jgi:hypothetical protein
VAPQYVHFAPHRRTWLTPRRLVAYYTEGTKHLLRRVFQDPELANIHVPPGIFKQSRLPKSRRMRDRAPSGASGPGRLTRVISAPGSEVDSKPTRPGSPQDQRRQQRRHDQNQNWPYPAAALAFAKLALPPLDSFRVAPPHVGDERERWLPRHPVDEQVLSRLHVQTVA